MTAAAEVRLLLLAMFLEAEEMAVMSYETCTYPGGVFDDAVWLRGDGSRFKLFKRVRRALGLKAFRHRDAKVYGRADDRLAEFRAKERAMIAKVPRP